MFHFISVIFTVLSEPTVGHYRR